MFTDTTGSADYAEVALEIWQPSQKLSDDLRDLIPNSHDLLGEIRRQIPPGVELMPNAHKGRELRLAADTGRAYQREKFYVRVFLDSEVVVAQDTDEVRRACFEGAALIGKRISFRVVDVLESFRPPPGASIDYGTARDIWIRTPMTVRFTGVPMHLPSRRWGDDAFACYDPLSDRVAIHFCSYFTIAPAGEEWVPE